MNTEAITESLPPLPRPREEVVERRLAYEGGDLFLDGIGSERQDTNEPIVPSRVDSEKENPHLAAPVLLSRFRGTRRGVKEGEKGEAGIASSGRSYHGRWGSEKRPWMVRGNWARTGRLKLAGEARRLWSLGRGRSALKQQRRAEDEDSKRGR